MQVQIVGYNLPGSRCGCGPDGREFTNIHVGIGSRGHAVELVAGDAESAEWRVDVRVASSDGDAFDFSGPFVDGRRGDRFIYLNWGTVDGDDFELFRRAKLGLSDLDPQLVEQALAAGHLRARVNLTDAKGNPTCARLHPPDLEWEVAPRSGS